MKKILSIFLTFTIMLTVLPFGLFVIPTAAATSGTTGDCTWTLDGTVLTISGNGKMQSYLYLYNGGIYTTNAPWGTSITEVVITEGVMNIGNYAFYNCKGLTSITIPKSVTNVGGYAFYNCNGLTSITIPENVTKVGGYAFYNCTELTSVTLPDSIISIGDRAFYGCLALKSVFIGNNILNIGDFAFYNCTNLTNVSISNISAWCNIDFGNSYSNPLCYGGNIYFNDKLVTNLVIPKDITEIKEFAFYNCNSIKTVIIENGVTSIEGSAFYECNNLVSITIPDSVTSIGDYLFFSCDKLASIRIPDSIISIGVCAFSSCNSLTSITIPDGVTSIGNSSFKNCKKLASVIIGDGVISIGDNVFENCTALMSLKIGNCVSSIGKDSFYGCSALEIVNISNVSTWCNIDFANSASNPLSYASNLYLNGELVTNLVIPDNLTSIGDFAFYGCDSIISITFPNCVTSIGDFAFCDCVGLTSVTIPDSVTSIGNSGFSGCTSLKNVIIGDGVTSIESSTFKNCDNVNRVTIGNMVTSIGSGAFYSCDNLIRVILPNSVTSIGDFAFYSCNELTYVCYSGAQDDCANISIGFYNDSLTNATWIYMETHEHNYKVIVTAPTCTGKGYKTYTCDCGDTYVDEELSPIGHKYSVDYDPYCDICGYQRFTTGGITGDCYWSIEGTTLTIFGNGEMNKHFLYSEVLDSSLSNFVTEVIISDGVKNIDDYAFYGWTKLTTITIPNSVTNIGNSAFEGCYNLSSITIPDSVTNISNNTFYGCYCLTNITIPKSVINIGNYSFFGCDNLKDVYFGGSKANRVKINIGLLNSWITNATWHYAEEHQHVAGEWEVVTEATVDADGLKVQKCSECGETLEEKVIPRVLNFRSKALALQSNISIIFRVDPVYFTKHGYTNPVVTFNFLGVDYPVTEYTVNASGLYEYSFNIVAPHQMKEMVYATFSAEYEGEVYTSAVQEYSIWTYCNNQLTKNSANPAFAKVMALLVDILNYGAAAQKYIATGDVAPEALANAELTDAQKALGNQDVISYADEKQLKNDLVEGALADIKVAGLTLQDSVVMNFKFELLNGAAKDGLVAVVTAAGKTWEIKASEFTYETTSGRWVINFNGLNPAQMREKVSVHLEKDGVIVSDTATYSVESYGLSTAAKGDARLAALVEAMAKYGRSAKAYNG